MTHTFQFGTANKPPVLGWTIVLLYPSFQDEESSEADGKGSRDPRGPLVIGKRLPAGVEHPITELRRGLGR